MPKTTKKPAVSESAGLSSGIGTLSEKSVHSFLKRLYMPDERMQEIPLGPYVADIYDGRRVTEIQTGRFAALRRKLDYYLPRYPVLVVHPVVLSSAIIWTDPETGLTSPPRTSPKHGKPAAALRELWQIRDYLADPGLTVEFVLLNAEEYRVRPAKNGRRAKRGTKIDRVPTELVEILRFETPEDYRYFLPPSLKSPFTVSDYRTCAGIGGMEAYSAVHVLESLGLIRRAEATPGEDGKPETKRRAARYEIIPLEEIRNGPDGTGEPVSKKKT